MPKNDDNESYSEFYERYMSNEPDDNQNNKPVMGFIVFICMVIAAVLTIWGAIALSKM